MTQERLRFTYERIRLTIVCEDIKKIRLHELNKISSSYQNILDRSYLAYQGTNRMTISERFNFYVTCEKLRSKPTPFSIDFLVQPEFSLENSNPISELMEGVFKLFKKAHEIGRRYEITTVSNQNITTVESEGHEIYVNPTLLKASKNARQSFYDLAFYMQKNGIEEITSYSLTGPKSGFSMTYKDAEELFPNLNPKIQYDKVPEYMNVKITDFSVSKQGKLSIIRPGKPKPQGIKFKVGNNKEHFGKSTEAMDNLDDNPKSYSRIKVTKDIIYNPKNGKKKINCLYIKSITNIIPA